MFNHLKKTTSSFNIWSPTFSVRLHPRRKVDGVPEQAVPGHLLAHYAGDYRSAVDADSQEQLLAGYMPGYMR